MRQVFDYVAFSPLIYNDLIAALGAGPENDQAWMWAKGGVRSLEQQIANLHYWIDVVASNIANQVNSLNPVNKLPDEVLCLIFAETLEGPDDIGSRVVLSEVCRHWENVLYNSKTSWATIAFDESNYSSVNTGLPQLRWLMDRSAPAPLDLDLTFRGGILSRRAEELMREHMYHTRSLALLAHSDVFDQQWRTALTMPAPLLARLGLTACMPYTTNWRDHHAVPFPINLFSDDAPRLAELYLASVALPPTSWSPLRSLETLTIRITIVDQLQLSHLVRACPSLRTLRVIARHSFDTVNPDSVPLHAVLTHPGPPICTFILYNWSALPPSVDDFLRLIGCQDPLRLGLILRDEQATQVWFLASMSNNRMGALHILLRPGDVLDGFTVAVTAHNSEGRTRAASFDVRSLATFSSAFDHLSELTLPERMWPINDLPALPNLHTLSIVLDDPAAVEPDTVSISLLSLTPDGFWDLPSLRTVHLAYVDTEEADSGGPSCWAKLRRYCVPLVISAFEVATFLTWNLRGAHPLCLVLQNVVFYEKSDSFAMQRLRALIHDLVLEHGYVPPVLEGISLCYS